MKKNILEKSMVLFFILLISCTDNKKDKTNQVVFMALFNKSSEATNKNDAKTQKPVPRTKFKDHRSAL